jgi:hypothetical protein
MNVMKSFFLLTSLVNSEQIIRNVKIPACRNCIHYIPSIVNADFNAPYNKCAKFGDKNIITDKITYEDALYCRTDETKCGFDAKYFEMEPNINEKIMKHKFMSWGPFVIGVPAVSLAWALIALKLFP